MNFLPFARTLKNLFRIRLTHIIQLDQVVFDQEILIERSPIKLSLPFAYDPEVICVDDAVLILIFEANKLRYVGIGIDACQLTIDWHCELHRSQFFFGMVKQSHLVSIKKL